MLVRTREGAVGLWNVATGAPVPGDLGTKAEGEVSVWSAAARRVLVGFKAGGAHCLLMGRAGSVLRYDARTWKPGGPALRQHDDIEGPSVEVSPNGKWLLSWGSDRSLRLLDAATGAVRGSHSSGAAIAQVVTDAAGGCVLFDNTAFLLQNHHAFYVVKMDFADFRITHSRRFPEAVQRRALSPDGTRLLSSRSSPRRCRAGRFRAGRRG